MTAAPDAFDAQLQLATSLRRLARVDEAEAAYRRALELAPSHPDALHGLGMVLQARGATGEALDVLQRAFAAAPGSAAICNQIGLIELDMGRHEAALEMFQRALALAPDSAVAHSNVLYVLSHASSDPAALFEAHLGYGARWEAPHRGHWQPHPNGRDGDRVLRIGFVSADLNNHAVTSFVEPVFELLGHGPELSLYVYDNSGCEDEVSARLRTHIQEWRPIRALDDEAAAALVRQDAIDILIDLSGHTAGNRLPLFARKPAPVQASWIGYAGTTGLTAMDYYISDGFHLPEGLYDDQFVEQIARLPLAAHFTPPAGAPPPGPLPALANGHLTFGSFNRASKLGRPVIALWASLLRAVPDAKLLLAGLLPGADATVLGWFDDEGIDRARLQLHPRTGMGGYLALHQQVDVCLSTFPYSGATTVCNALWMGVPTLAITGPTNPSHSAAWYLAHLGLDAFIAHDADTFVQLGVFLSQNPHELAALREGMRERFVRSVAGYPQIAAAGLHLALRRMWRRWCDGLPAAPLRVTLDEVLPPPATA